MMDVFDLYTDAAIWYSSLVFSFSCVLFELRLCSSITCKCGLHTSRPSLGF